MSVRVMSLVWGWTLPATEKLVALKLADCADDAGRNAYPAVATIATDCGLTRRGTQKVLERLVAKGCIEVQSGHTNRRSTTYRVLLNAQLRGEPGSPLEVNHVRPSEVNDVPLEANDVRPRGEPRSPLEVNHVRPIRPGSVLEPSENPRAREGRRPHPLDEPAVLDPKSLALFDELWAIYPRQDARLAAMKAWHALAPSLELGAFIVAHVRARLSVGWARDNPLNFLPQLRTFLDEKRWQERYTPPAQTSALGGKLPRPASRDGLLVMRSCPDCGENQEGRVLDGANVYPPCARCAQRAGSPLRALEVTA